MLRAVKVALRGPNKASACSMVDKAALGVVALHHVTRLTALVAVVKVHVIRILVVRDRHLLALLATLYSLDASIKQLLRGKATGGLQGR